MIDAAEKHPAGQLVLQGQKWKTIITYMLQLN